MGGKTDRWTPFSVLLVMAALSVVGLMSLPGLKVQYLPSTEGRSLTVTYSYPYASAESVEAEATSLIEGALAGLRGVTDIRSSSSKGSGSVTVTFRKGTDMSSARFEVASAIRNIRDDLPSDLSYPTVAMSRSREQSSIVYQVNGNLPSREITKFLEEHVLWRLSSIGGVDRIDVDGDNPFQWTVVFDADKARSAGVTAEDIVNALRSQNIVHDIGTVKNEDGMVSVLLSEEPQDGFATIPIKNADGRIIHLEDIADWKFEESLPSRYFRINGLNTVTLSIGLASSENLLSTASAVRSCMHELEASFPQGVSSMLAYDASEYVSGEITKVLERTALCVLVLLLFVFLTTFSWSYLLIVVLTLAVNVLTALAIYSFFGVPIHIYTLAGITVSLGIVIDTSIVMVDHYRYEHDRKVFPAILAAVATTIGALLMVLLLPENEKANLTDFIWVIATNLTLSLLICYLFIPSLMEYVRVDSGFKARSVRKLRKAVRFEHAYSRYIIWGLNHRWVYFILFIIAFGIPLCVLPKALPEHEKENARGFRKAVDKVVSWAPYEKNRYRIDKILGSSFGLFYSSLDRANFYREPARQQLYIRAGMLEGCTVAQLNEVIREMENYLARFDGISVFRTTISSFDNAQIVVEFTPEAEASSFPLQLKADVTKMAINFGGANWRVYGIDQNSFNNNVVSYFKSYRITLSGYSYDDVRDYADTVLNLLAAQRRVQEPEIWSGGWYGRPSTEFVLDYDFGRMAAAGVNPYSFYNALSQPLYERDIASWAAPDGSLVPLRLKSSEAESYDLWHVLNSPIESDGKSVVLSGIGSIEKKKTGLRIERENQSYILNVCYDFIGSYELQKKLSDQIVRHMNEEVLPVGFKAEDGSRGWFDNRKEKYAWLIFLIIAVIYVILSMAFESFRLPLAVIFMIPISFIGLFLTFGLSDFTFDQGGFAALVMLSGMVVNAGIYLVSAYQNLGGGVTGDGVKTYVRAFSMKIIPILLTTVSTILGLLPFLSDGPQEVFWFDFAVGTISGMAFSLLAIILVLPVFALRRKTMR